MPLAKMHTLFSHTLLSGNKICVAAIGSYAFFGAWLSAAHFFISKEDVYMFENIGKKCKSLAELLCWIGIFVSVIGAIVIIFIGVDENVDELTVFGIVFLIVGPLLSWVSSFFMYGFGELIDKTSDIEINTRGGKIELGIQPKADNQHALKNSNLDTYTKNEDDEEDDENDTLRTVLILIGSIMVPALIIWLVSLALSLL